MKVAPVSNICYLVFPAHLCPVRPRVLDSCSLIYRAIHIREVYGTPLSQSLIHSYFLGPKLVWGFITILYLCHVLLLYLRLCEVLHTVLFRIGTRFRGVDKPRLGFPVVHSRLPSTLRPSRSLLTPLRDLLKGWPPEIFLNLVIALS